MSQSKQFRDEGNRMYARSKEEGIGSSIQKHRIESAKILYNKALDAATTDEEKASAAKNLFIMSERLCELYAASDIQLLTYNFREAKISQDTALKFGRRVKNGEWKDGIALKFEGLLTNIQDNIHENMVVGSRYQPYHKMIMDVAEIFQGVPEVQAKLYLMMITKYFHFSVEVAEAGAYSQALGFLHDCYTPMELGNSLLSRKPRLPDGFVELPGEFRVKQEEIKMQMAICRGRLGIDKGDTLQKRLLLGEESLNMELAWETADAFRDAIICTKDPETNQSYDIEVEAIACSRLGVLYDKVMQNVSMTLAKPCFRRAVELAMTLRPRDVTRNDWFKVAQQTLKKYQELLERNDRDAEMSRKSKFLAEMKEEKEKLDKLKNKDWLTLLRGVYREFPLKSGKKVTDSELAKLSKSTETLQRSVLKKAITDYHPDRNKKYGEHWEVLCEEICKYLTVQYEILGCGL